jgi:hypothetical protein
MGRPKKPDFPIGFEEFLRYALPKKRPEDRLKFYRLFVRDYLHRPATIKASESEIEAEITKNRQNKFDENTAYHFRMWMNMSLSEWEKENRHNRAKLMAAGRWKKRKNK